MKNEIYFEAVEVNNQVSETHHIIQASDKCKWTDYLMHEQLWCWTKGEHLNSLQKNYLKEAFQRYPNDKYKMKK